MEENKNNEAGQPASQPSPVPPPPPPAAPPPPQEQVKEPSVDEQKKLADEIEKIKKKQKFFKVVVIILCAIILAAGALGVYVYRKISAFRSMFDAMENVSRGDENAFGGNFMPPVNTASIPVSTSSAGGMNSSSLSHIGFDPEMVSAMNNRENVEEVRAVVEDYKNNPEIKKFMAELAQDPELKDIVSNPGDPSKVMDLMKKLNDPKVMSRLSAKIMENPSVLPALMKMANDPRMKQMMSQQGSVGVDPSKTMKKSSKTKSGPPAEPANAPDFGEQEPPDDGE